MHGLKQASILAYDNLVKYLQLYVYKPVGKTLAGYKRGHPLPVLPRIRPRLPRGTQRVTHDGMPRQTLTSTRAIRFTGGDIPSQ